MKLLFLPVLLIVGVSLIFVGYTKFKEVGTRSKSVVDEINHQFNLTEEINAKPNVEVHEEDQQMKFYGSILEYGKDTNAIANIDGQWYTLGSTINGKIIESIGLEFVVIGGRKYD